MAKPFQAIAPIAIGVVLVAGAAAAQIVINPSEKIVFTAKRGPKPTQPGFTAGEYSGFVIGLGPKDASTADFHVRAPGWASPVSAHCESGQSKRPLTWVTWTRADIAYNCTFGGGAPADAVMTVAVFDSSVLPEPPPPRRAGEIVWGTTTIRFDTEHIGGLPISTGEPIGYVFSRDGREIGGVDLGDGVTPPSVFIPGKGDLNRDPTMIAALALLYFQDPGRS